MAAVFSSGAYRPQVRRGRHRPPARSRLHALRRSLSAWATPGPLRVRSAASFVRLLFRLVRAERNLPQEYVSARQVSALPPVPAWGVGVCGALHSPTPTLPLPGNGQRRVPSSRRDFSPRFRRFTAPLLAHAIPTLQYSARRRRLSLGSRSDRPRYAITTLDHRAGSAATNGLSRDVGSRTAL